MPAIPLGLKSYQRLASFQPEVELVNLYLEADESGGSPDKFMRIKRPMLSRFATLGSAISGIFRKEGVLGGAPFATAGATLFDLSGGAATSVGSVGSGYRSAFAATFDRIYVLPDADAASWDGTTLRSVTMPDSVPLADLDTINNYTILGCENGDFYWILPGEDQPDPLDFASAESAPDGLVAVRRVVDEFWLFGKSSTEVWQTTGDADLPFQRAAGRQFERGCLARSTVRRFDNSLVWVGDDAIVYRGGAVPQRISDHGIEERIRRRLGEPSAWVLETDGHKFYVLEVPGVGSFAYDASTQVWSEFASEGSATWRAGVGVSEGGVTYAGDSLSGAVWAIDPEAVTDDGLSVRCAISGSIAFQGRGARNSSLSIGAGGSADYTLKIRWKDGNEEWPAYFEEVEIRAPSDVATIYRLGSSDQPFRTFQIETSDDVQLRISGAVLNEGWQ